MFYKQLAFLFLYYGNMENLNAIIIHFQANLVARSHLVRECRNVRNVTLL